MRIPGVPLSGFLPANSSQSARFASLSELEQQTLTRIPPQGLHWPAGADTWCLNNDRAVIARMCRLP